MCQQASRIDDSDIRLLADFIAPGSVDTCMIIEAVAAGVIALAFLVSVASDLGIFYLVFSAAVSIAVYRLTKQYSGPDDDNPA